jgi:hypothetical protein
MKAARSNPVMMPESEQSTRTSRKGAMHGQMRPDNALPMFDGTPGSHGLIPDIEKVGRDRSPSRINALKHVFPRRTKHGSMRPCPRQQSHCRRSQGASGLLLNGIQSASKPQGLGQSQADLFREHLDLPLHPAVAEVPSSSNSSSSASVSS